MNTLTVTHILVPIDLSPHSAQALRWAALLQQTLGSTVTVGHAMSFEPPREFTVEQLPYLQQQANTALCDCAPAAARTIMLPAGKPAEAVLRLAAEENVDLIVMGSMPKPFLDFHLLPDTVQQVLRYGGTPVLVVPSAGGSRP